MGAWEQTRLGRPEVGASASLSKQLGRHEVELFSEMTGDRNPLHVDEEAARASRFGALITQCGVTSGLLNAVGVVCLDGTAVTYTVGLGGGTDGAG